MATVLTLAADAEPIFHSEGDSFCAVNDSGADLPAGSVVTLAGDNSVVAITRDMIPQDRVGAFHMCLKRPIWQFKYGSAATCAIGERLTMAADGTLTVSATGEWMGMPRGNTPAGTAGGLEAADGAALNGDTHIFACRYASDPA